MSLLRELWVAMRDGMHGNAQGSVLGTESDGGDSRSPIGTALEMRQAISNENSDRCGGATCGRPFTNNSCRRLKRF